MYKTFLATILLTTTLLASELDFRGQASLWNNSTFNALDESQIGLRYIPELSVSQRLSGGRMVDAVVSFNSTAGYDFADHASSSTFSTYRAWLRFSGEQYEARVGLQQIKFGPAMILRPLMWFDQLDPRDPLQFTTGVPAVLVRYYFLNNANIWLWGVLGDDETKGLEVVPSEKNSAEYGGRVQMPTFAGELAFSFHHRTASLAGLLPKQWKNYAEPFSENRYAIDGKWDFGIGLWFEGAVVHQDFDERNLFFDHIYFDLEGKNYQKYLTIGADYTFGLGNGLYLACEHLKFDLSDNLSSKGEGAEFSALMASYNVSLWDMVMGISYYSWETEDFFNFLTWRRTFDNFSFNASLFWNPETPLVGMGKNSSTIGAGRGFQIMIIYNH